MASRVLLEESNRLKQEAEKVLKLIGIVNYLRKFGEVNIVGSYSYNVMMARDIDFHIIIDEFSEQLIKNFFIYAVDSSFFEEIVFRDKHKFNKEAALRYASKKALDSYYFGLKTNHNSKTWQIGINFITKKQETSVEIGKLFERATDDQREQILVYKKLIKGMGVEVSSTYIYRAVLEKGVNDEKELMAYLKAVGYIF